MPFGVLKNRRKVNLTLDNKFAAWLHHKSKETGTPISRIVEIATIEKYKQEYEAFEYKGGEDMSTKSTTLKLLVGAIVTATLFGASGTLPEKVYAAPPTTSADTATITKQATLSNVKISVNGATPVEIRGYNIDGNNYFRIADIGKVLDMKVAHFPTQLGDGVNVISDKVFDGTVESFPTESQMAVSMKTINVFFDSGHYIAQCFNYKDRNYIRLADVVSAANLSYKLQYDAAIDAAKKGTGQAVYKSGTDFKITPVDLKTSYNASTNTIYIETTKTDCIKLYHEVYTQTHGKLPNGLTQEGEPKQFDVKAQPELTQAPEVGTILAKVLKDTSKPAYIDGKMNLENYTAPYAKASGGDCIWYARGRFEEVTGIIYPSTTVYDLDRVANNDQLKVITDPNKIVARSIAVFGKQHALFVEYVERDTQGNPTYIYFSEANQGTNAIYTPDKDGVIKKLDFKAFINRQATYSGCITLK